MVGTAGWTDKSLVESGKFYPADVKTAEARLHYYATRFPLVEVDSTYYGLPSERNARLWAERTPEGFKFNVKAFRLFTGHSTPLAALPKDIREQLSDRKTLYYKDTPDELRDELWKRYLGALEPLREAGKLGALHFQFAPWLGFHPESIDHLEECRSRLPAASYTVATEFRNRSWFDERHLERTLELERSHNFVHVTVDEPQGFGSSVPPVWEVTHPELALVRLHGRNAETWNKKGLKVASERFNYDYSESELKALSEPLQELAARVRRTEVIFNNNYQDQGQRNGRLLQRLLDPP